MDHSKKFFDDYAKKWDKVNHYNKPLSEFKRLISSLNIGIGSKVVDLGCGTGILIPLLNKIVGETGSIYAVDSSDKMLEELGKKYKNKNISSFNFKAEELSKIGNTVDAIICFSAFPHIEDKHQAIKEIASLIKPKGRFLIAHFSSRDEINSFHSKLPEPICHHTLPDKETMTRILSEHGLKVLNYTDESSKYELLSEKYGI